MATPETALEVVANHTVELLRRDPGDGPRLRQGESEPGHAAGWVIDHGAGYDSRWEAITSSKPASLGMIRERTRF